ncbi:hypothetical protein Lsai_2410 [Legionella sainthelensi]|uniref:Uncharacterized protein n=1 Tax=Legionella sainthelensi TaxID=28087 RepID=A0A0W0YDG5_9GAMM|nr:hypothetical protein Lsai_2410 [Legionella sainthelensi]VEH37445.1 Uncharacterised protein [Legionella sainthelensi]
MLSRIAAVLKLPVAYFYADSDDLADLIKAYKGLNNEQKNILFLFYILLFIRKNVGRAEHIALTVYHRSSSFIRS